MKNRNEETKEMGQIEVLFPNIASPFEFEKLQEAFDGIHFKVIDANVNGNGCFYGLVRCLGFPFFFKAHEENGHTDIDIIESIELPHNNNFDPEKAEREFAELDVFS